MLHRILPPLSIVSLIASALMLMSSCARDPAPGEVILLISSDLAVPTDVDTLKITVTHAGQSETISEQCYWLNGFNPGTMPGCPAASLPGSLALVASDAKNGLLKVHLELRQGDVKGALRVQRDAELQIPSEGVKQLPMPLDFLCLEGSLRAACERGMTCRAGSCVDDQVEQLPDYVKTSSSGSCLDVLACFGGINSINAPVPQVDDSLKRCAIRGNQALGAVNVNVALIVNRTAVGNYGVCDATSARCLVPLDKGPEGWQTLTDSSGNAVAIGLPDAVCDTNTLSKSILGLVVSSSANCATKSESIGLCQETPICVPVADKRMCPDAWSGVSCSGAAPPSDNPLDWCGRVNADPTTGPVVPGLWCCAERDPEPAPPNPHLIDDMSSGPLLKLQPGGEFLPGGWFSATDDTNAELSPPPVPALFSYRAFHPAVVPAAGAPAISHAACLRSEKGFTGYAAMEGFIFSLSTTDGQAVPFDVSGYSGIRFWAYSVPPKAGKLDLPTQIRVQFANVDTYTESAQSTCVRKDGRDQCNDFGKVITLPEDHSWAPYVIKWADLQQQPGWGTQFPAGFDPHVYTVLFLIRGGGPDIRNIPFDFCVAQIEFTED